MKAYKYRMLLWGLLSAADSKEYESLTIDDVTRHADAKTIPSFLVDRFKGDLDLSVMEADDWRDLSERWANISNVADFRRKFGVENRGICLLMAFALESMQMLDRQEKPV